MAQLAELMLLTGLVLSQSTSGPERDPATNSLEKVAKKMVRDEKLASHPIIEVDLRGPQVTDQTLASLKHLPDLRRLDLSCSNITDDGLKHLKSLTKLEVLELNLTRVTEKGLDHLKGLPNLQTLSLFVTSIRPEEIGRLAEFKQLRNLRLDRENDLEKGIADLRQALPQLKIDQGNGNSAEKRVRKYFAIADTEAINKSTIRSAVLVSLPLGSSEEKIHQFLKTSGVTDDRHSGVFPKEHGRIVCRIGFDPDSGWIVHQHYGIFFSVDPKKGLDEVVVQRWLTGP